jgi:hypothetical protein
MRIESDRMEDLKDVEAAGSAGSSMNAVGGGASLGGRGGPGTAGLQYSIPGILHFLQHEWSRFEMERGQWEVERSELQVRYHFSLVGQHLHLDHEANCCCLFLVGADSLPSGRT